MTVKGWMVALAGVGAFLVSACGHNDHNGTYGPGLFSAAAGELTCEQQKIMLDSGYTVQQEGDEMVAYDRRGDSYVLTEGEAAAQTLFDHCADDVYRHHDGHLPNHDRDRDFNDRPQFRNN